MGDAWHHREGAQVAVWIADRALTGGHEAHMADRVALDKRDGHPGVGRRQPFGRPLALVLEDRRRPALRREVDVGVEADPDVVQDRVEVVDPGAPELDFGGHARAYSAGGPPRARRSTSP